MENGNEISSLGNVTISLGNTPHEMFDTIKRFFCDRSIFGQVMSLEFRGISYRVWCDDQCFMVYRANDGFGSFHHVPGWPVCLVTSHTVFEECKAASLADDHHSCELDLMQWLEMIANHLSRREVETQCRLEF